MSQTPSAPPILSTPNTHIFEDPTPYTPSQNEPKLSDEQLYTIYEIARTAGEIREGRWRRIALQFEDGMLRHAPRVFEALERELKKGSTRDEKVAEGLGSEDTTGRENLEQSFNKVVPGEQEPDQGRIKLYILADTSYGACCVDEIAAEHVDADVVVHYGRSCLSPTARLPVIYVFTSRPLLLDPVIEAFQETYSDKENRVVLMADIIYQSHVQGLGERLRECGYRNILAVDIIHDPSSLIPNRKIDIGAEELKTYSLFHVSEPPPALLLTLSSRVKDMHIYPTSPSNTITKTLQTNTALSLRRRYGLLTSLSTCSIFGILVNTLSVKNYLPTVSSIKAQIERAGKKSYTFVVGKINAAKIANFSEIGGWVVVGCWESSLIESTEFYRPIITPFELRLALQGDGERVWSGEWRGDFGGLDSGDAGFGIPPLNEHSGGIQSAVGDKWTEDQHHHDVEKGDVDSEEESEPPEFDLRTGRYVSHSRPMRISGPAQTAAGGGRSMAQEDTAASKVLTRRAKGDLVTVNGAVSPGAEYLKNQRTWTGLGSDFHEGEAGLAIDEGRSGVARGYTVGEEVERR